LLFVGNNDYRIDIALRADGRLSMPASSASS
jgi:hypothetical protein